MSSSAHCLTLHVLCLVSCVLTPTPSTLRSVQAMRLFVGEPVWTPYNRDAIDAGTNESRLKYETSFLAAQAV